MDTLWDKIKRGLQEGATTAAAKAEYLGRLGKTRLEVARSRHAHVGDEHGRRGDRGHRLGSRRHDV